MNWLSGFLFNPWMAAGAGAVASPILIHILSRRRFRRVRWAAMEFLLVAQRRNRRRVRLEQLIVLALRCLAVLLIAFAFARPFFSGGRFAALVGGSQTEHVVLLDDTFSMSAIEKDGSAGAAHGSHFHEGKGAVAAIAKMLGESSPGDALSLYVSSRPDEPVISLSSLSDSQQVRLSESLAGLAPTHHAGDFDRCLSRIARQLAASTTRANTAFYILSDFQRTDWQPRSATKNGEATGPLGALARLSSEDRSVRAILVNLASGAPGNVAITGIKPDRPQTVAGVPARFVASIANYTGQVLRDVELGVSIDHRRLPPVTIAEIVPGETVREPVEISFEADGPNFIELEILGSALERDAIALDNVRAASVDVAGAIRVLVVDGEPSSDAYRDEVFLLRTALRPSGRATSGNDVTVIEDAEFDETDLSGFHVVMLANVGRVSRAGAERLGEFVRAGGGLIVFAGDLIDVVDYNETLYAGGKGLLPLPLVGPAEAPPGASALGIESWDSAHPMLRAFAGPMAELLRQVRIDAYLRVEAPADVIADDIATAAAPATVEDEPPAVVIARLNDAYESPVIVEKQAGAGRCIFVATTADQEWNDWASNFSYLPFILEAVQYVARPLQLERDTVVGEPLVCTVDPAQYEATVKLRTPEFPAEPEITLTKKSDATNDEGGASAPQGGKKPVSFADTDRVGRYQFVLDRIRGGATTRYAIVNPNATESNPAPATEAGLRATAPDLRVDYVAAPADLVGAGETGRTEFWWPLLLAAVAVLMTEHWLAWRFGAQA